MWFTRLKSKTNKVTKIVLFSTHAGYHFVLSYSKLLLNYIYINSLLLVFPVMYEVDALRI